MKTLVTGAAGFVGSHLVERLLADGATVTGVDAMTGYYEPAVKRRNVAGLLDDPGFRMVEGDLNTLALPPLLAEADVVYHLAGQPGVRSSWGTEFAVYLDDNVRATQRLLEAAREQAIDRFVLASSSSIYGDAERFPTSETETPRPISPYGVTKLAAEHLCYLYWRAFEVPTVSLRYFTIFGPRQRPDMAFHRFITAALRDETITIYGDGQQSRDFTYVDDCVAATIAAGSQGRPGAAYNVAGGTQATVLDVVERLEGLLKRRPRVEHRPAVSGDARKTRAETSAARKDLSYRPSISLVEGLKRQLEEHRSRDTGAAG